jgi:2-polyprenyl-6-methoxyphenol hydroxylase-like FAD-dependent oxidoreductase
VVNEPSSDTAGERTALIVGAGVGGLAAGIALRRAGWKTLVFERADNPRELGFALNLAPNAMAALGELGLGERLIAEGVVTDHIEVRSDDGRVLRRVDVGSSRKPGAWPGLVALRRTLYGALLDQTDAPSLVLGSEAVSFQPSDARVTLTLRDGRTFDGDLLVGADGIHSVVRRQLHPQEPPLRASGYHGVRGVALGVARHLGGLSAVGYLGDGYESAAAPAGMDAVYWYLSLRSEEIPDGDPDAGEVMRTWTPRLPPPMRAIVSATKPDDRRLDALFDRDPLAEWGSGAVTLLGDAAHPMMPHTGQGAAQALEDAVALGIVLRAPGDVRAALRRYERVRAARTSKIVKIGRRIPKTTTTHGRAIRWLREAALRTLPESLLLRGVYLGAAGEDPHRSLR